MFRRGQRANGEQRCFFFFWNLGWLRSHTYRIKFVTVDYIFIFSGRSRKSAGQMSAAPPAPELTNDRPPLPSHHRTSRPLSERKRTDAFRITHCGVRCLYSLFAIHRSKVLFEQPFVNCNWLTWNKLVRIPVQHFLSYNYSRSAHNLRPCALKKKTGNLRGNSGPRPWFVTFASVTHSDD